jgi:aquaporin Z
MKITKSALYGELLGTYAMVFCGTAAMAVNEVNGSISHVGVAITWGLIVMAMIYAFGELSGAHFNPAVTVGFALSGRFAWKNVPIYIVMQVIAAILASITVKYLLPESEFIGASIPSIDATRAFVLETILTFILMIVIIHISTGSKEIGPVAGLAVGSVILLEAMFAGPLTNASMNPARSLGPAIVSGHFQSLWIYLTAPFLGASLAVVIARRF